MAKPKLHTFSTDYAIPPGEILEETLTACNMQKSELAERCRLPVEMVNLIIDGKAPITSETATRLEKVLGISAKMWINLDINYHLPQTRE
jgi:addiction module HigA family antidote